MFNPEVKVRLRPGEEVSGRSTNLQPFIHHPSPSERRHKSLHHSRAEVTLTTPMSCSDCCRHRSNERTRRHRSVWLINTEIPAHPSHSTRAGVIFSVRLCCLQINSRESWVFIHSQTGHLQVIHTHNGLSNEQLHTEQWSRWSSGHCFTAAVSTILHDDVYTLSVSNQQEDVVQITLFTQCL